MNLARFLSVIKIREKIWKTNHPFVVADRYQNETEGNVTDETDCSVSFFGYIRGSSMRISQKMHIPGLGDYNVKEIKALQDPCPSIIQEKLKEAAKNKRRTLKKNERIIYAPFSNLGFLNFEGTGGFITIPK